MSSPAQRRVMRDLKKLQEDPPCGVCGLPTDDLMLWDAIIFGPKDTPFENGTFHLKIGFGEEYPLMPPKVIFISDIFHPNIYANGAVCLDLLGKKWSPTYDASMILVAIQFLLGNPNPDSPANIMAAKLYIENRQEYENRVRACVEDTFDNV